MCCWHWGRQFLMDVTLALKEESKCKHFGRLEITKWICNQPHNCLKGRGLLSLHLREFICMSIDKNDLHCYQLTTIYRAIKKPQRQCKLQNPQWIRMRWSRRMCSRQGPVLYGSPDPYAAECWVSGEVLERFPDLITLHLYHALQSEYYNFFFSREETEAQRGFFKTTKMLENMCPRY